MTALTEWGSRIAKSAIAIENVPSGPWAGSMESRTADRIPREYAAGKNSTNVLYLPRSGTFKRRGGQTQKFDTFGGSAVGMLPAKWSGKVRQMEEFLSEMATDGVPTIMALVTKETVASGLDDGWFSNVWLRDQVVGANYTLGSEYSSTTYPVLGSAQPYKIVPLWYESGDGGITRGTTEFLQRFFVPGSRRFLKNGNWWYFPSLKGTPCRWNGGRAGGGGALQASDDLTSPEEWESVNTSECWEGILTSDDATAYASRSEITGSYNQRMLLSGTVSASDISWTVNYRARRTGALAADTAVRFYIVRSDGQQFVSADILPQSAWTTSWVDYTATISTIGATGQTANSFMLSAGVGSSGGNRMDITYVSIGSSSTTYNNRLIPSGPLPPTHAGTIAAGNVVQGEDAATAVHPDADNTDGSWLNQSGSAANLYQSIDEDTPDAADYIVSSVSPVVPCKIGIGNFGFTPASDSIVKIVWRGYRGYPSVTSSITVKLYQGATLKATSNTAFSNPGTIQTTYVLSAAEISSISDWNDLFLQFDTSGGTEAAGGYMRVLYAEVTYEPSAVAAEGSWRGHDRFFYSVAYRFEDGSVWAPCTPRLLSAQLSNGFNLCTVDTSNPDAQYDFVTWSNIPIGPHGVVGRLLLRTPKVDSTVTGDELKLNPFDFRLVVELTDNSTTTYVDYQADDFGLYEDTANLFIRYDYIMPPRARYVAGGDMRVVHAYGGQNPCAIVVAPVGRSADYDLNLLDSTASLYSSQASYMRYRIETDGNATLRLVQGDGATATNTKTLDMDDYPTLQKLVDAINATSFAVDGQTWRAQLCPGANPEAPSKTVLTPHIREIASVVTASGAATLIKSAGGLSAVPVGALVSMTNVTAGTYVTRIDSDTQLTMSANATGTGTNTASFHASLGDVAITGELGWQRVIANSLPGFLYFAQSYLDDDPIDKSSVWMTAASPGSMRSAANNFSGLPANRLKPPTNAGISMGGAAVDQGFVLPFSGGVFALKNTRDTGTGVDEDYKLVELNANRGCIAWNTVTPGNRFVPYLTAEGLCAADLEREFLVSDALFLHAPATGGMSYEIPLCVAASAKDDDTAFAVCRVMRSAIWLNYRTAAAPTHPNRQVVLDFSSGHVSNGLEALFRSEPLLDERGHIVAPAGSLYGWSTPLVRSLTAMCEGRRSDGGHLYGWNDANAGATGDGRIDEFETGDTDNGTAIAGEVRYPWERLGRHTKLSAQEIVIEHAAPAGATVFMDYHRSYSDTTYPLTLSTTAADVGREVKFLPQAARTVTAACFVGYRQTAGGAAELRAFTLRAKPAPSYT